MDEPAAHPVRATDSERERVAERLRVAAGEGQLTVEELDERLDRAYSARTRAELEPLTADLQVGGGAPVERPGGFSVRRGAGGDQWIVSVMGGSDRRGRWRIASRCTALNVMGGSDIDLNEVELADDHVELTVCSIMGGSTIYVPHGMAVEVTEFALMGGNDIEVAIREEAPAGGPVLRLRIVSIMGGTDVKRGRRLTRAERRELERRQRDEHHGRLHG